MGRGMSVARPFLMQTRQRTRSPGAEIRLVAVGALVLSFLSGVAAPGCSSEGFEPPDGGGSGGSGDASADGGSCHGLDQAQCAARAGCTVSTCNGCGTVPRYEGCRDPGDQVRPSCPLVVCAAPCSLATTEAACDALPGCHPVFRDSSLVCDCAGVGCSCVSFSSCADGGLADCSGPAQCDALAPYCSGDYVVAYSGTCYQGCVRKSNCPPRI